MEIPVITHIAGICPLYGYSFDLMVIHDMDKDFTRRVKRTIHELRAYFSADRIVGGYVGIKAKDHRVNMFDYHPEIQSYNRYNLGDYLGFVVADWMLAKKGLSLDTWVKKRKHFNCIGSNVFASYQHTTLWGSGLLMEPDSKIKRLLIRYPLSKYDFRAVRGPLSRDVILRFGHKCPEIYGDPAILMPLIYNPARVVKHDLLVIPQFKTEAEFRNNHPDLFTVSMNTNDYNAVIDKIVSSKKVITSSLHAIILSDAYGVPSVFFRGLDKVKDFKYLDYYYSTGRRDVKIADSFEEALEMTPLPLPDLKPLQEGLLKTFPYDLWEE